MIAGPIPSVGTDCSRSREKASSSHIHGKDGSNQRSVARVLDRSNSAGAAREAQSRSSAASEAPAIAPEPRPIPPRSLELTEDVIKQMRAEDFCVNTCQWVVDKLRSAMTTRAHGWAPTHPMDIKKGWLDDLERAAGRVVTAKSTVVVVGDTGAGKSSLLNALLDETSLLPTNGMRACTGRRRSLCVIAPSMSALS
jgi:hypothetical protein